MDFEQITALPVLSESIPQHLEDGVTGNPAWYAWRKVTDDTGPRITATMAVAIAGVSPYQTRYGLWLDLTGQSPMVTPQKKNGYVLSRGLHAEAAALAALAVHLGVDATTITSPLVSRGGEGFWVAASLDGAVPDPYGAGTLLATGEFKLNGAPRHEVALSGGNSDN